MCVCSVVDIAFPHFPPCQLGWRPHLKSYMNTLPDSIDADNRQLILDLFDWLVQPSLGELVTLTSQYTYTYSQECPLVQPCVYVCVCTCLCMYMCVCTCVYVHVCVRMYSILSAKLNKCTYDHNTYICVCLCRLMCVAMHSTRSELGTVSFEPYWVLLVNIFSYHRLYLTRVQAVCEDS